MEQVNILENGDYKYMLMKNKKDSKYYIRSYDGCNFHYEIMEKFQKQNGLKSKEVDSCGGGRITFLSKDKQIKIYGHSVDFGPADHNIGAKMLKEYYNDFTVIAEQ
ncbi:hypothetical protein SNEBB_005590 [Seison nebaliae]|nr:hypothetical protein SNEBB_005590 [Seison nebaliae]